ncbi:outer membrane protein 9 [Anaplasma centrale str. Israel]|uniref:Outer membrane protein 9 n=1 Tax=Anaplasma centrale (strain Israel) TaxID=574556 RepID=D1ATI5_ANACI|nr:outer membrane protein 9 [Anaplasma centrale str. Israel]
MKCVAHSLQPPGGCGDTGFYLGFGLAPSFGGVSDFYAEVPGAADAALPYRKDAMLLVAETRPPLTLIGWELVPVQVASTL